MIKREAPDFIWETVDALLRGEPVQAGERQRAQSYFEMTANQAQNEWNLYCGQFGLTPDQFGTTFQHRTGTFTVIGIKPKSRKYPVLARNAAGTTYKFPAYMLNPINRI